jgi:signal transduction histidine kinase
VIKKIIEMNNGKIWVESEVNKGSTFYISLPELNSTTKKKRV